VRYLASIVEGHGEVEALPALVHRIARSVSFAGILRVNPPIRVKSGSFLTDNDYFRKQAALATAKAAQVGGSVLILLDCEDDCPGVLGPALLKKAHAVRANVDILVALAHREYETWFLTAARSLRGLRGLPEDLDPPPVAEGIRDAKGWLSARMNDAYDPITHQLEFTKQFDLEQARANQSFDRLCNWIRRFLQEEVAR
jgi:hypothetical protein